MGVRFRKRYSHGHSRIRGKRGDVAVPMLVRDFQDDVQSMADGRYYSSKSHWREHLRANGLVELGNDTPGGPETSPAISEEDIAQAYEQCEQGAGAKPKGGPPAGWEGDPAELAMEDA